MCVKQYSHTFNYQFHLRLSPHLLLPVVSLLPFKQALPGPSTWPWLCRHSSRMRLVAKLKWISLTNSHQDVTFGVNGGVLLASLAAKDVPQPVPIDPKLLGRKVRKGVMHCIIWQSCYEENSCSDGRRNDHWLRAEYFLLARFRFWNWRDRLQVSRFTARVQDRLCFIERMTFFEEFTPSTFPPPSDLWPNSSAVDVICKLLAVSLGYELSLFYSFYIRRTIWSFHTSHC